jgi:hypothetical protein
LLELYITFLERREHGRVVSPGRTAARKQSASLERRWRSAKLDFSTLSKPIIGRAEVLGEVREFSYLIEPAFSCQLWSCLLAIYRPKESQLGAISLVNSLRVFSPRARSGQFSLYSNRQVSTIRLASVKAMNQWYSSFYLLQDRHNLFTGKNGKPISRIVVFVSTREVDSLAITPGEKITRVTTKTDKEGKVRFRLSRPLPKFIIISYSSMDLYGCSEGRFSPEEVLRIGTIAQYHPDYCPARKWQVTPKPGEIIIFEKRMTFWDQIKRELP